MTDDLRAALAAQDYYECCGAIRALRLVCRGLRTLPRTRGDVRLEVRFWIAAARRAKQTMASTACTQ